MLGFAICDPYRFGAAAAGQRREQLEAAEVFGEVRQANDRPLLPEPAFAPENTGGTDGPAQ
jgi:hypothetical protein